MALSILVAFTGGTIGSRKTGHLIDTDAAAGYALLETFQADHPHSDVAFTTCQPLNILSENLIPQDWQTLLDALEEEDADSFDGIIIPHGTDTLPYTAAALSYTLAHLRIPVVLIGSHYPLADPRSEGHRNFAAAVAFIRESRCPGVFVAFENDQGEMVLHLGSRLHQAAAFTDAFLSVGNAPFGYMRDGCFQWNDHPLNPEEPDLWEMRPALTRRPAFATDLLYIRPQPGLDYGLFDFTQRRPRAILHDLNHSGTASSRHPESQFSLTAFVHRCRDLAVPVYLAPIKNRSADLYATASALREAGAVPLENISMEAAWTKLLLAYGVHADVQAADRFLANEIFFEFAMIRR